MNEVEWQAHLSQRRQPQFHILYADSANELAYAKKGCERLAWSYFYVDAARVRSHDELMDALRDVADFPAYFGRNWNAVIDLMSDLSWRRPSRGYVLAINNADALRRIWGRVFRALCVALEAIVRRWRDTRGEYAERSEPVYFHVVVTGDLKLLRSFLDKTLRESFCLHRDDGSCDVVGLPSGIYSRTLARLPRDMWTHGPNTERLLSALKRLDVEPLDAAYALAATTDQGLEQAQAALEASHIWDGSILTAERGREMARRSLIDSEGQEGRKRD